MPFYEVDVVAPAQTLESAPAEVSVSLIAGLVTHVDVQFPRGCVGLVHAQIWRSDFQVWPTNPDGNLKGDNVVVGWDDEYPVEDEPLALRLLVWNDDDSYAHRVTFRLALTPLQLAAERAQSPGLLRRIAEGLGIGG